MKRDYSERMSTRVTKEKKREVKQLVDETEYHSESEYLRSMIEAGESNIAALDPRTSDTESPGEVAHDSAEGAAKSLSDAAILSHLPDDENGTQGFDEIVGVLRKEFENVIAQRLQELSQESSSPVESDGRGNYWVKQ